MSPNPDLTTAGSSTYASNTLHVGDGTWDSGRDTFLLPNLMGLNFAAMQYNGMGNRFRDMPGYHQMICAHGVLATIAFLGLVPFSVLLVRYYSRWNPFWAFKLHVWCQVLTLFLSTVAFVLGWFAVGPKRSLSNPHHGIGLAIYVMVIFQVFWGYLVHKVERTRTRFHVPVKLVIHRWIGRILTILGVIQIPLGLTLYGSPKVLFILYAIAVFTYLVLFIVLSYLYDTEGYPASEYDSRGSYLSGPSRSHGYDDSHASYMDEKYSDEKPPRSRWKKKFLEFGVIGGGLLLAKKLWDRRRNRDDDRDDDTESGKYSGTLTRSDSMTEESMSRLEDGRRPEPTHRTPLNRPPTRPQSRSQSPGSSYFNSTYLSGSRPAQSHAGRNAFFGAGALAAVKNFFSGRKTSEQHRVEDMRRQDMQEEKLARANSKRRYTGDGYLPPRNQRDTSYAETSSDPREDLALSGHPGRYDGVSSDMPPAPPAHGSGDHSLPSEIASTEPESSSAAAAPPPMAPSRRRQRSISRDRQEHTDSPPLSVKLKMHNDGRHVTLRRLTEEEAAANRQAQRRRDQHHPSRRRTNSVSSLSGGEESGGAGGRDDSTDRWRRVEELERQQQEQIQREQEKAATTGPGGPRPPPTGPSSSFVYGPPPAAPPPQQRPPRMGNIPPPPAGPPGRPYPHPPPPSSSLPYGPGSIGSPGTFTGTEGSGDYAGNRRRRRAERARARQERQQSVDFT